jgi:hypothetical protein
MDDYKNLALSHIVLRLHGVEPWSRAKLILDVHIQPRLYLLHHIRIQGIPCVNGTRFRQRELKWVEGK